MRKTTLLALAALLVVLAVAGQDAAVSAQDAPTNGSPTSGPTPWVVTAVALGSNPRGVAVDPMNGQVYVGLSSGGPAANVAIIDSSSGTPLGMLGTQGTHPNGVAVNPQVYTCVTNKLSNDLSIFNTTTGAVRRVAVGSQPWGVAVHPTLNRIYVANFGDNSVSVVDGATGSVVKTTGSIPQPAFVAVDAANNRVYVTSIGQGLYILNATTGGMEAGPIVTSADSRGVAVHPITGRAYVVNHDPANPRLFVREPGGALSSTPLPAPPMNVAINPNTNHLFITLVTTGGWMSLHVLDSDTLQLITNIPIGPENAGDGGQGLAVDTTLNRVFVTRYQAGELVIIADPPAAAATATASATASATRTATPTLALPHTPTHTATPTTTRTGTATRTHTATASLPTATATATASRTRTTTATGTAWPSPTGTIGIVFTTTVGSSPKGIAADANTHRLYVTMIQENLVKVLDGHSGSFVKNLPTGSNGANGVAVNEQTGIVFVTNKTGGNISAINPASGSYQTVQSGFFPWGIAVDAAHNRVYVANFGTNDDPNTHTAAIFDATTLLPIAAPLIGRNPALVAVNPTLGRAYVTTYGTDAGGYVLDSGGNILDHLLTGSGSFGVAANSATGSVYVTNRMTQQLHIIAPGGRTAVALGAPGFGVAVNPATNHLFVVTIAGGQATLQVRDGDAGSLITSLPLGAEDENDGGQGIAVDTALSRVYVLGYQTGLLTAIADAVTPTSPTPSATATGAPTSTSTATPTATPTFAATPIGGWPHRSHLPVIVAEGQTPATPTATGTPTVTPTPGAVDWQIPDVLHISLVPANVASGQAYWKLVRAIYQDETQSGGNHNVYFRLEDEQQQALMGLYVCLGWPSGEDCSHFTEYHANYPAGYAADIPMWASYNPAYGPGPYSAWAAGLTSDRVAGMGLPLNYHVNFLLTFRRTVAP